MCFYFFPNLCNQSSLKRSRVKMSKNSQKLDYNSFDLDPMERDLVKKVLDLPFVKK